VFESRLRDWQQNPGLDGKPRSPEPQPPVEAEVEAEPGIPFAPDLKMELSEYITAIRTLHEAAEQAFDNLVAEIASFEAAIEELKA
jgi:hypothetical protein